MTFNVLFTVFGNPVGKQRPRFSKGRIYTPKKTVDYEKLIADEARKAMGSLKPLKTPILICININHAVPASYSKKRFEGCLNGLERPNKPDLDNCAKAYLDAMNGIVYDDDVQVVRLVATKRYNTVGFVDVSIREDLP